MKKILYGTCIILWLAGYGVVPTQSEALGIDGDAPYDIPEIKSIPLPAASKIRSEIFYHALVGDLAAQRGDYLVAEQHYADAAKLGKNAGSAELATRAALAAQDFKTAQNQLDYWLSLDPKNIGALQIAVLLAIQLNNLDASVEYLEHLVAAHVFDGNSYIDTIHWLEHVGKPELRLNLGRRLISKHLDDTQALYALAVLESGANSLDAAEGLIRKVLAKRPSWDEAQILLVRVLLARGNKAEASAVMEKFLNQAPKDSKLRLTYARLLIEQNAMKEAKQQFEHIYKDNPKDGDALFALGVLALQLKQPDEGANYLEKLYNIGEHRDDAAFFLGQIFEEKDQIDNALHWYNLVESDNKFESQVRIARIYAKRGSIAKAQEIIQQMRSQIGKDYTQMDLIEAEILQEAKQYQIAFGVLTQALKKDSGNQELLYARALAAVHLGHLDVAERDLKLIIAQDPKHIEALNALGYTLADSTNRYQEALSYIQRALDIKPNNPAILDSMGWVQYHLGHLDKAVSYLRQALKILFDPEIAAHLGEALWVSGDKNQALQVWQDAITKSPSNEFILKMQERYGVRF